MTTKVDLKRELDSYRARRGEFRTLEVPDHRYLMVDGHGDPNTSAEYTSALQSLYLLAYATKLASRDELGRDYVVPPLEGLWWADDMDVFTSDRDKEQWDWTMMILVPDWVGDEVVASARRAVERKGASQRLDDVRLEPLSEGLCVQTLHAGPYDAEAEVLADLHDRVVPERGLRLTGRHHEIYLGDPRRTAPERLRTILRQPVRPQGSA